MSKRTQNIAILTIITAVVAGAITWIIWMRPDQLFMKNLNARKDNTPTSGSVSIAADRPLFAVTTLQAQYFSAHYPDTRVSISESGSDRSLLRLIQHEVQGAMLNGPTTLQEDSLIGRMKLSLRKEPVARNAWVCIVNPGNPVRSFSLDGLRALFSGNHGGLNKVGGREIPLRPYITSDDFRLRTGLALKLYGSAVKLEAIPCGTEAEMIERVASEPGSMGILPLSSLANGTENRVRIVPVSTAFGSKPVAPAQFDIFTGNYPLSTIVYYVYDTHDPLAAGLGSWLAKEGQKAFERSVIAPYRREERKIILK
jgi:phosphate transport system substrate-binding protein